MPNGTTIVDGSINFDGGVNSVKVTTVASPNNPDGLLRNELAWLDNANVRDGGITQRGGWKPLVKVIATAGYLYQGGAFYDADGLSTYLMLAISGHIYKIDVDAGTIVDLTLAFPGTGMPASQPYFYFQQGEQFMIIQAGDYVTLPLFWDGTTLRRSLGIISANNVPGKPPLGVMPFNELPAAGPMDYYGNRLWYAFPGLLPGQQGIRTYTAGDIVGNQSSGTAPYGFRDSILKVTENPLAIGGDGFTVPTSAGNIRALKHSANLDTTLGQSQLFVFTRRSVYSLDVPVSRTAWIAADSNNQPLQSVVQVVNGSVNDRCVVPVNGDLYYQSFEPGIRSLINAIRYFNQPGNIQISANEQRILDFNDRSLMHFASGIEFDSRLLQTSLPKQNGINVTSSAIVPLDFIPMSYLQSNFNPIWGGMYEGLDFLQLFAADFGGLQRAFGAIVSQLDGSLEIWELTQDDPFSNGDNRVTWIIEWPAFTWGEEFEMKKLITTELWIDKLYGTVHFKLEWRVDSDPCWRLWKEWDLCTARTSAEDATNTVVYPLQTFCESFRATITTSEPPPQCVSATGRPANLGYQFQPRLTVSGFARVRGILLHAEKKDRQLFDNMVCSPFPVKFT